MKSVKKVMNSFYGVFITQNAEELREQYQITNKRDINVLSHIEGEFYNKNLWIMDTYKLNIFKRKNL